MALSQLGQHAAPRVGNPFLGRDNNRPSINRERKRPKLRLPPTVHAKPPPTLRRGGFGGSEPIYKVSFNSPIYLITSFLRDINLV